MNIHVLKIPVFRTEQDTKKAAFRRLSFQFYDFGVIYALRYRAPFELMQARAI